MTQTEEMFAKALREKERHTDPAQGFSPSKVLPGCHSDGDGDGGKINS